MDPFVLPCGLYCDGSFFRVPVCLFVVFPYVCPCVCLSVCLSVLLTYASPCVCVSVLDPSVVITFL